MLYYLCLLESICGPLRLFRYVTFRSAMGCVTALLWGVWISPKIFKWLQRLNAINTERTAEVFEVKSVFNQLEQLHQGKKHTTSMGGVAIVFGVLITALLWMKPNVYSYSALVAGLLMGVLGLTDDLLKVKCKNARGVSSHVKWLAQGLVTLGLLYFLLRIPEVGSKIDGLQLPFFKHPWVMTLPPMLLFLFWFFVISGTSNGVNLTDGMDGLAIGCSVIVLLTYSIVTYCTGNINFSHYLNIPYLRGVEELTVLCWGVAGAGIAFLWFNTYPAEIFMGDTGSLAIGTWIACVALITQQAFTLVIIGFVFVIETLSVILQLTSLKLFHKRCFKLAPIHHHFELSGLSEPKIVVRFWIISVLCALMGLMTLKLR